MTDCLSCQVCVLRCVNDDLAAQSQTITIQQMKWTAEYTRSAAYLRRSPSWPMHPSVLAKVSVQHPCRLLALCVLVPKAHELSHLRPQRRASFTTPEGESLVVYSESHAYSHDNVA